MTELEPQPERIRSITITAEDHQGVLQRIFNLISRRGFHLESCSIVKSHEDGTITIQALIDPGLQPPEQIERQLHRLIDVVRVLDHTDNDQVEWSSVLVKVNRRDYDFVMESIPKSCASSIVHSSADQIVIAAQGYTVELGVALTKLRENGIDYMASSLTMLLG